MVGLLADVEFQEFSFDGFLLVDGIKIGVKVFEGAQVLILDFGLSETRCTGACTI